MSSMKQIDGYKIFMNKLIGKGSFGSVYEGVSDTTGDKVAVKILPKASIDADKYLKNALFSEIKIMQCIKSDNVVGFYDVMESSKNYYLVQELCDGDLSSLMKAGQTIEEPRAKDFLLQIANGFLALVREGIIHRDLKPANIMMRGKSLKIGDFGFAKKSQTSSKISNQTIVGTPLYMSLQILKSQPYSSKCDIWALGFIYYQMLHGYPPWNGKSQYDLINKIQTRQLQISEKFSAQTKDFLKRCLQKQQQNRMSWDQLFVHPIFNGYFMKFSKGNQQFQNKLKTIMASLRFQINSQNLDLCKILAGLGYKGGESQLDKQRFFKFLQMINHDITRNQSDYIFNKTDYDRNGTISINQIEQIMNQNNISISTMNKRVPGFNKEYDGTESFEILNPETEKKIKACFGKLMRDINMYGSTLKDVYDNFDTQKKGKMNYDSFCQMIMAVGQDISKEQMKAAFDLIDQDGSKTVQYGELESYYIKVNGVSPNMQKKKNSSSDQTRMEQQPRQNSHQNYGNQNMGYQGQQNYGYQGQKPMNQGSSFNPFSALMFQQDGYVQPPPQMYQQPPPYNPYAYQQPPQSPPQQQKQGGGMFDNFIFGQLAGKNQGYGYGW